jgi:hypothetical protein
VYPDCPLYIRPHKSGAKGECCFQQPPCEHTNPANRRRRAFTVDPVMDQEQDHRDKGKDTAIGTFLPNEYN